MRTVPFTRQQQRCLLLRTSGRKRSNTVVVVVVLAAGVVGRSGRGGSEAVEAAVDAAAVGVV